MKGLSLNPVLIIIAYINKLKRNYAHFEYLLSKIYRQT